MNINLILVFVFFSISSGHKTNNEDISKRFVLDNSLSSQVTQQEIIIQQLRADMLKLQNTVSQLQSSSNVYQDSGSTYVRWGRKQCPGTNTELVYTGYAVGQKHAHGGVISNLGGPANMLCLPNNPQLSSRIVPGGSYIYGTKYEDNTFSSDAYDREVPCSVCRRVNSTASLMIPGRTSCYSGWNKEYQGIVASDLYSNKPSNYICVDSHPEYITEGQTSQDDRLLYATGTKCGSLPCPPYHDNSELYCVVCTK